MEFGAKAFSRFRDLRMAGIIILALAIPLACERSATADIEGPNGLSRQATVGSLITSDVVTTSTICTTPTSCHTRKSSSRVVQRVGTAKASNILTSIGAVSSNPSFARAWNGSSSGNAALSQTQTSDDQSEVKNLHVTGNTLSGDKVVKGRTWHVELTRDPNKGKKISGLRLYGDGELLIDSKTDWEDLGGAWYHKHSSISYYHKGRLAAQQEKSYAPISIESGKDRQSAGISSDDLTLRAVYAPDGDPNGCPFPEVPICDFFQSGNPIPILNGVISGLVWIADSISNWFNMLWAGAGATDASIAMTETVVTAMEAVAEPSLLNIAVAIGAAADGPLTKDVMEEIGVWIVEWLEGYILILLL